MADDPSKTPGTPAKSPSPQNIPLAKIHDLPGVFIPKQPDKSYGGLVSSIQASGVKEPVILRLREDGEYQLVAGYRRRRGSELAKKQDTGDQFPIIAVWENVMGAFVSNDRLDFLAVLRAFRPDAQIPMPASGRWGYAGMVRGGGPDLAWRTMDAQYWASPCLARRERIFLVADFGGRRAGEILFKPRTVFALSPPGPACRVPTARGDRGPFLKAGGRVPVTRPFQLFRMRGAAKNQEHVQFRDSFGFPTDPFPTLLAGAVTPFAFWFEDDPLDGCIRFPTERECERLMGLPEGWTKYGADGEKILPANRYKALGNAIALPCADYIMAGIVEALNNAGK